VSDLVSVRSTTYAQVRVREPLGERTLGETVSVGGEGADIVVPGVEAGAALTIDRRKGVWVVEPHTKAIRVNARPLAEPRDLRKHDTVAIGGAQIVVTDLTRTLLRIDVFHLVGNTTVAPAATLATLVLGDEGDEEVEIQPLATLRVVPLARAAVAAAEPPASGRQKQKWVFAGVAAVLLVIVAVLQALLEPVEIDVVPADAKLTTPDTLLAIHHPNSILMLPGDHKIRAERSGYVGAEEVVKVGGEAQTLRLRLAKLPGQLNVDTNGVAATVTVDGVEVGHAPGVVSVPAGDRTIMISSPRYVDYITNLTIDGAGERQDLHAKLQTSWGSLKILSNPEGAKISVDGADSGVSPVTVAAPSGVRRVQIALAGKKPWESSVVLKAGETLSIGPVALGEPDAHLTVRSDPSGADATVGGTHLGRTPAEIDLPSGIAHEVVLSMPGFKNWSQSVFAESGRKLSVFGKLEPILVKVVVQGQPVDAEVVIDGVVKGKAPQSLELTAAGHKIEVRKQGFAPYRGTVTPEPGLERTVQYRLELKK
jgi:hypothetical protein